MTLDDDSQWVSEDTSVLAGKLFDLAFANSVIGMAITDLNRGIVAINDSFCKMLGRDREEFLGHSMAQVTLPEDQNISDDLTALLLTGEKSQIVYTKRYYHKDGHIVWAEVSKSLAHNEVGEPYCFIALVRNVTEERSLLFQLTQQALHDPLTGLANRLLFEDRLNQALNSSTRKAGFVAVFLIDLDDFKDVNDTFGHQAGDDLIKAVANRLKQVTRSSDTLCRFGGDEFLYLREGLKSPHEAQQMAERLLHIFDEPFWIGEDSLPQSASIGVAISHRADDSADLIRHADIALYRVKRQNKSQYSLFHQEMQDQVSNRVGMANDLRQSLESGLVTIHYQPIVDLLTNVAVGFEALMRWNHPKRGWVPPTVFIPVAEQSKLIFDIGSFALGQAVGEAVSWGHIANIEPQPYVTVNLSPRQFQDPDLFRMISESLDANKLPPDRLVLEITEGTAFVDINQASHTAERLRAIGVGLAVDDFGTGYSSLSHIALLHPRILKIDQSFLDTAPDAVSSERLLKAILTMGDALDITVLAEGIETEVQLDMLRRLGCRFGQGYLLSPPVSSADLKKILRMVPTPAGLDKS